MFNTIKTWIHRIRNYDELFAQLQIERNTILKYGKENRRLRNRVHIVQTDVENLKRELEEWKKESEERRQNLHSMVRILSDGTWKEGDNMMEAIETAQERKYLKEHAEDFLMIMNGNVPEMAARELFEYFEVEVPDSGNIEIQTAKKLYDLWCRAKNDGRIDLGAEELKVESWASLRDNRKEFFIAEANRLWIIP